MPGHGIALPRTAPTAVAVMATAVALAGITSTVNHAENAAEAGEAGNVALVAATAYATRVVEIVKVVIVQSIFEMKTFPALRRRAHTRAVIFKSDVIEIHARVGKIDGDRWVVVVGEVVALVGARGVIVAASPWVRTCCQPDTPTSSGVG